MGKKKCDCPPAGAPEWMATYGDLVTLLLCFFILLFSMATIQKVKFEELTESLKKTLGLMPNKITVRAISSPRQPDSRFSKTIDIVAREGEDKSQTVIDPRDVVVVGGPILFDKGQAILKAEQYSTLYRISTQLKGTDQIIEIHGYCSPDPDDEPIKYNNKWELSFYRAQSVISFLTDKKLGKINFERIRISVHGEFDFRNTQLFTENRQERQRVEIITSPSRSSNIKDTKEAK
ncbi:MAG: hypothetical protein COA79_06230 [Planctomycetota bacterium]|nr:MAG: hypothetical protein COA79_06230 [Planctomycetota bacterium]